HSKDTNFSIFAKPIIINRFRSFFRKHDGLTEHAARQRYLFTKMRTALEHELKRLPENEEVYDRLGWHGRKRQNAKDLGRVSSSIHSDGHRESKNPLEIVSPILSPAKILEGHDLAMWAVSFVHTLPKIEFHVLAWRFSKGLKWTEIGAKMGTSERVAYQLG